ncbi:rod shape-determining protein RodA [Flavobacterium suncheonense]|uniref:Rod shape-determining protein RodA n=1 Tax=Flavobacterium suncheonense GH29-5 = DSM 17707 TaxID=1121899 RepID=A0A0A2MA61_9FLAO|nr:rod shape-determining protein RodA [Flavobacterium suncheonense]KGO88338.1 rod shape-determining protein RodA [Flavobacterium suncheonense GH29-5 = DSM 17707]
MKNQSVINNIDWLTVIIYTLLVIMGWMNIYSASLPAEETSIFDMSQTYGRQMLFIFLTIPLIFVILSMDAKIFEKYSTVFYILGIISLLGLFAFGKTIKGQTNWYQFGGFGFQPSEFVKTATALLLAKVVSDTQVNLKKFSHQLFALGVFCFPVMLILLQPDAGSAMIFLSLIFVLYREGLPSWYLWTGFIGAALFILALIVKPVFLIGFAALVMIVHYIFNTRITRNPIIYGLIFLLITGMVFSVDYVYEEVLEPHQKDRINVLIGEDVDMKKEGYNLNQSLIAIGSGGWTGKGYLEGTQTKGGFVPEQHTDYIFTTVGEEWGFVGATVVITLFVLLFLRLIKMAENQKTKFSRVYGYCVVSYLFTHFFVNIAMLIKMFPTIGVPLPFFSYGGSSLWAFTILLFIFIKMDANKVNEW